FGLGLAGNILHARRHLSIGLNAKSRVSSVIARRQRRRSNPGGSCGNSWIATLTLFAHDDGKKNVKPVFAAHNAPVP
ncbi:MAG: hypothetical protein ACT4OY_00050, partial [Alphaproteobacteria bacterium]